MVRMWTGYFLLWCAVAHTLVGAWLASKASAPSAIAHAYSYTLRQRVKNGLCNLLSLCKEMKLFDRSPDLVEFLSTISSLYLLSFSCGTQVQPVLRGSLTMDQLATLGLPKTEFIHLLISHPEIPLCFFFSSVI